jgi:hypothetical protein
MSGIRKAKTSTVEVIPRHRSRYSSVRVRVQEELKD